MNIFEKYKDSHLYMVSGLDSLGVPYTIDNNEIKSFVDLVADKFKEEGIRIDYVNLHSLAKNKTWELKQILDRNYSKSEYYKINKQLNKFVIDRSKEKNIRFNHPINPKFINIYYEEITNPNKKITTSLISEKSPIFLYSCGGMNFDYYMKFPSCDFKQILPEIIMHTSENIKKTMDDIDDCIKYILNLNKNINIYVLGVYSMIENKTLRFFAQPLYALYNNKIKNICSKYNNVHYVDIFDTKKYVAHHDNHPTFEGQKYMAKQIIKSMQEQ